MSKVKVVKEDESGNVALNCPICNKRLFNDADAKKNPMAFNPCKHVAFMGDQEGFDGISKKMRKVVENVRAEICDDCGDADDKDVIKALKKMYPTLVECRVDAQGNRSNRKAKGRWLETLKETYAFGDPLLTEAFGKVRQSLTAPRPASVEYDKLGNGVYEHEGVLHIRDCSLIYKDVVKSGDYPVTARKPILD